MIYHIASAEDWNTAQIKGLYKPEGLLRDGFIHCSTVDQFLQVANFYFSERKGLVALEIDEGLLRAELRWEGQEGYTFPHIYGPLEVSAVVRVAELKPNAKGLFEFPFERVLH